jgi:hypothetical protein
VGEGTSVLRIYERSRDNLWSIFVGKLSVSWLLATVEVMVQEQG